jgi:hypothetical protein
MTSNLIILTSNNDFRLVLLSPLITTYLLMQIGLQGETLQIYTEQGSSQVQWKKFSNAGNPLTWYKVTNFFFFLKNRT